MSIYLYSLVYVFDGKLIVLEIESYMKYKKKNNNNNISSSFLSGRLRVIVQEVFINNITISRGLFLRFPKIFAILSVVRV
jgi:hypothetical protein